MGVESGRDDVNGGYVEFQDDKTVSWDKKKRANTELRTVKAKIGNKREHRHIWRHDEFRIDGAETPV